MRHTAQDELANCRTFSQPDDQQGHAQRLNQCFNFFDGIFAARKAVMHETQRQGVAGVTLDDIYLGNGASELIGEVFGATIGAHARSAFGVAQIPLGCCVEIEMIAEVE